MTLTPEANAEVRRNLRNAFLLLAVPLFLFLILLAVLINPPGGTQGFRLASLMLVAFCLPVLAMSGGCLTLAYPLGCWPGFMRAKRLAELYGVEPRALSNQGMRPWMKQPAYWMSFAKGAAVGLAFVGPWFLLAWAMNRFPQGIVFPALGFFLFMGGLAAKAWVVRKLVFEEPIRD